MFKEGLSLEENIENYERLFVGILGNKENLGIVTINKKKVLKLVRPFLEKNEKLRQTEFHAKLKVVKQLASENRIPLKKVV